MMHKRALPHTTSLKSNKRARTNHTTPTVITRRHFEQHSRHPYAQPEGNRFLSATNEALHIECRKGLGVLATLPDALLLDLLKWLNVDDVARLARCSKALYVFSREEDLWRSFVLTLSRGSFVFVRSWFDTVLAAAPTSPLRMAINATRSLPTDNTSTSTIDSTSTSSTTALVGEIFRASIEIKGFYSDTLIQSWRCGHAQLEPFCRVDNIERRSGLTRAEFLEQYERPNKPVILTDIVDKWPAFHNWTKETLLQRYGSVEFKIGSVDMTLENYWRYCDQACEETPLYLFDNDFTTKAPEMGREYSVPDIFPEDFFSLLDGDGGGGDGCGEAGEDDSRPSYRWILIGPPRSGSTFHKDPNFTSAWNGLISGWKKWMLFPPHQPPPGVFPSADEADVTTPISVSEWFLNYYHESQSLVPIECNQRAGELLFIPNQWWHTALNIEPSIAVTQNYVSQSNLFDVLEFLERNHKPILKATLEYRIRQRVPNVMETVDQRRLQRKQPTRSLWHELTSCTTQQDSSSTSSTLDSSTTTQPFSFSFSFS